MRRPRIYVAGPFSGNGSFAVLDNMRRGISYCVDLLLDGYDPYCPWLDFMFRLLTPDGLNYSEDRIYSYSINMMLAMDAVLVMPGWENSKGTRKEIEAARKAGIPVFFNRRELDEWRKSSELERS